MKKISEEAMALLKYFGKDSIEKAQIAINNNKAFCPTCHLSGMSNCGYFDECYAFIMPNGERSK